MELMAHGVNGLTLKFLSKYKHTFLFLLTVFVIEIWHIIFHSVSCVNKNPGNNNVTRIPAKVTKHLPGFF